ncbi:hypothetical protein BH18ACT11_BH18ACT11_15610 [soil metagenome]
MAQPLILTLKMDDRSQEHFDRLRELYFPPERNYLSAHLTLFYKLPGEHQAVISADLQDLCLHQTPFTLNTSGLRFLGRGVAYELYSPELVSIRNDLVRRWEPWLGPQDRQGFKPHVTVQNKVSPESAYPARATPGGLLAVRGQGRRPHAVALPGRTLGAGSHVFFRSEAGERGYLIPGPGEWQRHKGTSSRAQDYVFYCSWIPAFAGMTEGRTSTPAGREPERERTRYKVTVSVPSSGL